MYWLFVLKKCYILKKLLTQTIFFWLRFNFIIRDCQKRVDIWTESWINRKIQKYLVKRYDFFISNANKGDFWHIVGRLVTTVSWMLYEYVPISSLTASQCIWWRMNQHFVTMYDLTWNVYIFVLESSYSYQFSHCAE